VEHKTETFSVKLEDHAAGSADSLGMSALAMLERTSQPTSSASKSEKGHRPLAESMPPLERPKEERKQETKRESKTTHAESKSKPKNPKLAKNVVPKELKPEVYAEAQELIAAGVPRYKNVEIKAIRLVGTGNTKPLKLIGELDAACPFAEQRHEDGSLPCAQFPQPGGLATITCSHKDCKNPGRTSSLRACVAWAVGRLAQRSPLEALSWAPCHPRTIGQGREQETAQS
jgi:hypothetical protein